MSNKVYIKNNLARQKAAEEAAKLLEEEAKKGMLWGFRKERNIPKEPKTPKKDSEE